MYSRATREEVARRRTRGESVRAVAAALGLSTSTVRGWATVGVRAADTACWLCQPRALETHTCDTYAYLLGQYLGDGHLVISARVPKLRIACADAYPGIAAKVDLAMHALSGNHVGSVQSIGCSEHSCYWMHWPCLFPQHGPGRKHERPIVLADWQRDLVAEHPWPLIRGLIHSDGCRATNRVVVRGKAYEYPRYFFANESRDILATAGNALDAVGVAWRFNRPNSISIARREAVEVMERHVGPKR